MTLDSYARDRIEREAREKLQAGDKLYRVYSRFWRNAATVEITKVTKTQLVLNDGSRLNRETLRKIGAGRFESNGYYVIVPHTTERVTRDQAEFARTELAASLSRQMGDIVRHMDSSELAALQAVIERYDGRVAAERAAYEAERAERDARFYQERNESKSLQEIQAVRSADDGQAADRD